MIFFPSQNQYREMTDIASSLYVKGSAVAERALQSGKEGVLSCIAKISNSVATMKKVVSEGVHRLSNLWRPKQEPSATNVSSSLPVKIPIDPISVEFTRSVCHAVREEMCRDPAYLNRMFRGETNISRSTLNGLLKDPNVFLEAIRSNKVDGVAMSSLVKHWSEQALANNKFTHEERQKLAANTDNRVEVLKIFNGKFDLSQAGARDNKDKLISLFSVMRTYKEECDKNIHVQGRAYDSSVVDKICSARIFDISANLDTIQAESSEAGKAIAALLKYCPPGVLPKPPTLP
ncbi:hypothetical protein AB8989_19120 [Yersinia hibernica]|uniref:Uncharacterized protein n=1 Tax=Yersinia hibernica TaxID=2339259 RepID=A0ABX5R264_9GAMM|nr:hypothetical protein [Yersinia hibernica]QAX79423.1 hypothetical protein D5F51_13170 [Yersinia hibernica]